MTYPNSKLSEVAAALALTPRRIQQLVKEGVLPIPIKRQYDLKSCIEAYKKYIEQQTAEKSSRINSLNAERLRLLKAQADKAELEVEILEGKYIAASEVELLWSGLLVAFRARMLSLPTSLARQLIALGGDLAAITHTLEQEIHTALLELSNYQVEEQNTNPADSKDSSTAAQANG